MRRVVLLMLGAFLSGNVWSEDVSALQTAVQIARDEVSKALKARDTLSQRVAREENELAELKAQLEADRIKAAESAKHYLESKEKYDKAQAALDRAWKK